MPPKIWSIIKDLSGTAVDIYRDQRKLVMSGLSIIGLIILGIIVIPWAVNYQPKFRITASSSGVSDEIKPLSLPEEEFFLPDEPDFLPKVLLEREPRKRWTAEDAVPFWKDPAGSNPETWRKTIETVIDELLEGVP